MVGKQYRKGKHRPLRINESSFQVCKKEHEKDKCHFYGKPRHF
jgi:hypothetical protein